jgi:hypothetical protein
LKQILDLDLPLEAHVEQLLTGGERAVDEDLELVGQLILDVLLDPAQHERLQDHVKTTYLL